MYFRGVYYIRTASGAGGFLADVVHDGLDVGALEGMALALWMLC